MRRLNVDIQYIPGPRTKVADGLSRTLFQTDLTDHAVETCGKALREQGPRSIWKDGKDGFEAFLKVLNPAMKVEVVDHSTLEGVSVFRVEAMAGEAQASSWSAAYLASD